MFLMKRFVFFWYGLIFVVTTSTTTADDKTFNEFKEENNRNLVSQEYMQGAGLPPIYAIQAQLDGRRCDIVRYKELNISGWWTDYFNSSVNISMFSALYELTKSEQMNNDIFKKDLSDVCFAGFRLYECKEGSDGIPRCGCMSKPNGGPIDTIPYTFSDKRRLSLDNGNSSGNTTTGNEMKGNKTLLVHCLIGLAQKCAPRTRPRDYKMYATTKRTCEPGLCCKYNGTEGISTCQPCFKPNSSVTKKQNILPIILILWFLEFH